MKICVLSPADGWHYLDLKRAAGRDHEITSLNFESLTGTIGAIAGSPAPNLRHRLQDFDCVLARAMPYGSLQQVIFRMDVLLELEQRGVRIVNPPRTIESSVDKYLSLTQLHRDGVWVPPTAVSQTIPEAVAHFERLGGNVVMKPLFGSMGRGVEAIDCLEDAKERFADVISADSVVYQQARIDHGGFDLRLLVIGSDVISMKRTNPHHWVTNIARGGTGHPHTPTDTERQIALSAARAVGAEIAGVDLVYDRGSGRAYVLEINSAPAWRALSKTLNLDVAGRVLDYLTGQVLNAKA